MKKIIQLSTFLFLGLLLISAGYPNLPHVLFNYANITLPAEFTSTYVNGVDNTPVDNAVTDAGAALGRVLFYDVNLSVNNSVSCASCHQQGAGFSDPDQFSTGFNGQLTSRNSMPIINARWYDNGRFFWDERAASLEAQALIPIESAVEMGMDLDDLIIKLGGIDYYPDLFEAAFGSSIINRDRIGKALAQFQRSIISDNAPFDIGIRAAGSINANFSNFTAEENLGKSLFRGRDANNQNRGINCANCHMDDFNQGNEAIFKDVVARNIGLDLGTEIGVDNGEGGANGNANDIGKFKSPSLRNVELTAPYMHDGRFSTLEEVIDHYSTDIKAHPRLDNRLRDRRNGPPTTPNYSAAEKAALVAFLKTLTDPNIATDPRWSDPFNTTECTAPSIALTTDIDDGVYRKVSDAITTSGTVNVVSGKDVILEAANAITLSPGFHAASGATLTIKIEDCVSTSFLEETNAESTAREKMNSELLPEQTVSSSLSLRNLKVYPNPFTNELTIDLGTYTNKTIEIHLFNAIGQKVNKFNTQDRITIDLSQLEQGIYFVRILENGIVLSTKKVIKG